MSNTAPNSSKPAQRQRSLAAWGLVAVAAVWGATFPLVKGTLAETPPLLFNLLRMALASAVLLALYGRELRGLHPPSALLAATAGLLLGVGYELQTVGLALTSSVHSAFLTSLVVILVPLETILLGLASGRPAFLRNAARSLASAIVALCGVLLLVLPAGALRSSDPSSPNMGDVLTLGAAIAFSGHLLLLSKLSRLSTEAALTLQIVAATLLMFLCLPLSPATPFHATWKLGITLLVTSVLATAAAFQVQTWAQRHLTAASTAMLLSLEPVFALLTALLFAGEHLTPRALAGILLILGAILLSQIPGLPTPMAAPPA